MAEGDTHGISGSPSENNPGVATGTELAGYRVESLLGRGGMGVVYRAHDLALDRKVALKLLAPELAEDVRFRERFLRESRLAASLDHPAIVPIYDAGGVAGQLYIAMRLVEGTDLKQLLAAEGPMDPERALSLLAPVADALDAAHERGLVHRDVKPSNVLVDERGHAYLADFGLSRRLAEGPGAQGAAGSLGTVDYVAPEQIRGDELDGRADLYSLGCLLYECLAGRPPFAGASDTAVVFAHLQEEPPGFPGFEYVMKKALAKEPDDRYQSGRELVAAARAGLRPRTRPRRRWLVATAVVLAAVGAATGGFLAARDGRSPARTAAKVEQISLNPNALNLIDARTRHGAGEIGLGAEATLADTGADIVFAGRSAWLLPGNDEPVVDRVDLATRKVTRAVKLPWPPGERLASGGGLVWATEAVNGGPQLIGIDGRTGRIVRRFAVGSGSVGPGIAYGAGSLWLSLDVEVVRVDPRTGRVLHRFRIPSRWVTFADGAAWAASSGGLVWKIDPVENRSTAHARLHGFVSDLTVGGGFVWVAVVGDDAVYKLSEDDLSVQSGVPGGPDPERLSFGGGHLWIANTAAEAISQLDPTSGARRALDARAEPVTAAYHGGLVWTGAASGLAPLRPISGPVLRIATSYMHADPVRRWGAPQDEQLFYATCATLLNHPDSAGQAGTHLRPEIASGMPTVSPDGRTYSFRIRHGFRFSPPSNEPVTAASFRHMFERALSPAVQGQPNTLDIVGAAAFHEGKAAQIAGIAVDGARLRITLVRPAGDFLTRISMPTYCPVPADVPLDWKAVTGPIPTAGPYYIASLEGHRMVLERNPNYHGNRPRRLARVVVWDNIPTPKAIALAEAGQLDYLPHDFSNDGLLPGQLLDRRYGPASAAARADRQRFYLHARPLLDTIVFNTRRPLFRNTRMRRAVSYALDRPALARAYFDQPAAKIVPAAVPGDRTPSVYPIGAPDLRTARRLAGAEKRRAVLLAPCDPTVSTAAGIVRSDLARIGIEVSIVRSDTCDPSEEAAEFNRADMVITTTLQRFPPERDPAPFVEDALGASLWGSPLGPGPWNNPAFTKRLEQARPRRGRGRVAAYARLDSQLMRMAPLVVYGSYLYDEYFSPRIGCKLFQAFYLEADLGALCVRKR
jgi:ABC-type transport system substrate-binding protein